METGVSSLGLRARLRIAGLLAFLALQWVPYRRPLEGPGDGEPPLPPRLKTWVQQRCYDCHSQQVRWPWYSSVAPVSWWLADEVRRGQAGVNFSRWHHYTPRQQRLAWRRSLARIRENLMPPASYLWMHPQPMDEDEIRQLEDFIQQQERERANDLLAAELLAWPSAPPGKGGPIQGVQRLSGVVSQPLVLQQGLLLVEGDLVLEQAVRGQGAVLATGNLTVRRVEPGHPLAFFSLGKLQLERASALAPHFRMTVPGVRQLRLEYCRDDGELGERLERQIVIRQSIASGEMVLWDPEFQRVERARNPEAALLAIERLLAADSATSLWRWRRRFRKSWRQRLEQMSQGLGAEAAVLELDLTPRSSRTAAPAEGS